MHSRSRLMETSARRVAELATAPVRLCYPLTIILRTSEESKGLTLLSATSTAASSPRACVFSMFNQGMIQRRASAASSGTWSLASLVRAARLRA